MEMHTAGSLQRVHGIALAPARSGAGSIHQFALNVAARVSTAANATVAAWFRSLREQKAIDQLQQMDDRMLADIGMTRGEIPHAVRCEGRWQHCAKAGKPGRGA
jgi:uncharacterized protein YjiS (DUF1127 family)